MTSATSNSTQLWAYLLVEELVRCGVRQFFLAPGSRSTPLAVAIAEQPKATCTVHFDERGTAFAALGYARATGRPAGWVTTSGTALANGFPAIVEASIDHVPMLLLTADRPPELRDTGANQTIDQVKLFGGYVRAFFDLPAPSPAIPPAFLLTTVDQAVHAAASGPVHLNLMYREPLAPTPQDWDAETYLAPLARWRASEMPYTRYERPPATGLDGLESVAPIVQSARRGVILAGRLPTPEAASSVAELARQWGWPLLADIGSHLRLGARAGGAIAYGEALLGSPAFLKSHTPDVVVQIGDRLTSRRMQNLPASPGVTHVVVHPTGHRLDPLHTVNLRIEGDVAACCRRLGALPPPVAPGWRAAWEAADRRAGDLLEAYWHHAPLGEPGLAHHISRLLPAGSALCLGSSMPIRDMDRFATADGASVRVYANRGASGIDGTLATAAGIAHGSDGPVTVLLGDLALLHDLNSLALLRACRQPVPVVVVNNGGGGIFSFLPISSFPHVFEPYFAAAHDIAFAPAAALFGLPYAAPTDAEAFALAYRAACERPGPTLIEVCTDREANVQEHRALDALLAPVLDPPSPVSTP